MHRACTQAVEIATGAPGGGNVTSISLGGNVVVTWTDDSVANAVGIEHQRSSGQDPEHLASPGWRRSFDGPSRFDPRPRRIDVVGGEERRAS
jgi:hypothetical protein